MMPPLIGALSPTVWTGVAVGAALGVLNLVASSWTTRKSLALGERYAIKVMILGFLARLGLLALIIFAVPRDWMSPEAFIVTFLVAFVLGIAFEARVVMRSGHGKRGSDDAPAA